MTADKAENELKGAPIRILVIGGQSRAAQAFRKHAASIADFALTTLVRRRCPNIGKEELIEVTDYFDPSRDDLRMADVVINFAGITHGRDVALLDEVNVKGPQRLAAKAEQAGTHHFIHLSSLHVYGCQERISPATVEAPETPYGRSKLLADTALLKLQSESFSVTILRLPMLYGTGLQNNVRRLAALMTRMGFFPVKRSPVLRSVLHLDNLAAVIATVIRSRARGIRFAADFDPFTIELLVETLGAVTGRPPRLLHLPDAVFLPLRLLMKSYYCRLFQSNLVQQVDCVMSDGPLPVILRDGLKDMLLNERVSA